MLSTAQAERLSLPIARQRLLPHIPMCSIRNDYISFNWWHMGIIKISENMHERLRSTSTALSRSINAQAEHWLRVGMLAELNPSLSYGDICRMLIEAEARGEELSPTQSATHGIEQVA